LVVRDTHAMGANLAPSQFALPACECEAEAATQTRVRLRVGGIREPLLTPLQQAVSSERYLPLGINAGWVACPPDVRAITSMMSAGILDVAFIYTEDAVMQAASSSQVRIIGTLAEDTRAWGLHLPANLASPAFRGEVVDERAVAVPQGVSARIAAWLLAEGVGAPLRSSRLYAFEKLQEARQAMTTGRVWMALWETARSGRLVASGEWLRYREVVPPWPSILVVASREALRSKPAAIRRFMEKGAEVCEEFKQQTTHIALSRLFDWPLERAGAWLASARWVCSCVVERSTLTGPLECLRQMGLLSEERCHDPLRLLARDLCALEDSMSISMHSSMSFNECGDGEGDFSPPQDLDELTGRQAFATPPCDRRAGGAAATEEDCEPTSAELVHCAPVPAG